MDELILLSEGDAARAFFASRNGRVLFRLLLVFTLWSLAEAVYWLVQDDPLQAARAGLSLILIRVLTLLRRRPLLGRHFRPVLVVFLSLELLLLKPFVLDPAASFVPHDFVLPFVLLFFRLPPAQAAIPLGVLWASAAGRDILTAAIGELEVATWVVVAQTAIVILVLRWGSVLSHRMRRDFLDDWRRECRRHREQRRMREELDDARRIQLSMLPRHDPDLPWLEVAGISIPASEVGGDYYDYFRVSETRQAVVVADVAGHGVASGLLLSGIRSCLYLLHETPLEPAEILDRLDRMVRQTTGKRMFVTMLYALFDHATRELTVATAGHPPPLHYRAARGEVEELTLPALPLGTGLRGEHRQRVVPFAGDDLFLFYTDGIAETLNVRDDVYGDRRLSERLGGISHDRSAREIRDSLLADLWNFKGDGQQLDDITLVLIKIR